MDRTVKKNLVIFIILVICISQFFSINPFAVNDNSEANAAVSGSNGCKWVEINNGLYGGIIQDLAVDPTNTQTIYAGTDGAGVFKSTDGGASWIQINTGLTNTNVCSFVVDPKNSQVLYVGTDGGGIFKSTDGGTHWKQMNNGLTESYVASLAIDPKNSETVYAGTWGGVFKSTNGGTSWKGIDNGLTDKWAFFLAIDPENTNIIYAGTWGSGIYKSTDGGAHWSEMNSGLTNTDVDSLAIDPTNTQIIYAGTGGGGVFKRTCSPISPSSPPNLQSNASTSSITLSWTPSTQGTYPIAGYAIYRGTYPGGEGSAPIATVGANTTTYRDTNVEMGKTYYYYVKAYDNQNPPNYSKPSNEVKAALLDTTPPTITVSYPIDGSTVNTHSITVRGTATDKESGIASLTINGYDVDVSSYDNSFSYTLTLTEGYNTIKIVAIDKAGNRKEKDISVTYSNPVTVIKLQIGNSVAYINDKLYTLDSPPIIRNNRTLVPIRFISEGFGAKVEWHPENDREVRIFYKNKLIHLWINKDFAVIEYTDSSQPTRKIDLDSPPIITNSRTMVPLRFISESMGATVEWDGTTRTVTITMENGG